ncbi:hypothetical protein XELAEV_18031197mg [Xenopus laevis]|uniref:Uncharacterized protein n=1 Tax=Xenopus laevis TaxID=8355 RepID=A0A974HFH4_XENLA|nr:hypothetical protein XELAEV_18031197mg [Xenopus laevis]
MRAKSQSGSGAEKDGEGEDQDWTRQEEEGDDSTGTDWTGQEWNRNRLDGTGRCGHRSDQTGDRVQKETGVDSKTGLEWIARQEQKEIRVDSKRGLEQDSKRGLEQDSKRGLEQDSKRGLEQDSKRGLEQDSKRGLEQDSKRGLEQDSKRGLEQERTGAREDWSKIAREDWVQGRVRKQESGTGKTRLDYCNLLLTGLPNSHISPLQSVLNTAARIILLSSKRVQAPPLLKSLSWLPIKQRITYKLLLITFNALHSSAPNYISSLVSLYVPA